MRNATSAILSNLLIITLTSCGLQPAPARELVPGQWAQAFPPETQQWYRKLQRPYDGYPCCGDADAYEADDFERDGNGYVAILTCNERPVDEPDSIALCQRMACFTSTRCKPVLPLGTRFPVPGNVIQTEPPNPTGHGITFVDRQGEVICYCPPSGA